MQIWFFKTIKGVDKNKRKAKKDEIVIINEKRVQDFLHFLFPLNLYSNTNTARISHPVGPEWTVKTMFQDSTMLRDMVKERAIFSAVSERFK
ncbi:hypothetical protein HOY82DRAFT_609526 [Tuber indicum]|nr:hypothetical protein HOY82DRAFT_609526 [Tuber indicum]